MIDFKRGTVTVQGLVLNGRTKEKKVAVFPFVRPKTAYSNGYTWYTVQSTDEENSIYRLEICFSPKGGLCEIFLYPTIEHSAAFDDAGLRGKHWDTVRDEMTRWLNGRTGHQATRGKFFGGRWFLRDDCDRNFQLCIVLQYGRH